MPPRLNLSNAKLERHGCYVLENGQRILIWIGRSAVSQLCLDLLGVPNINDVTSGQVTNTLVAKVD
jgi:protein transport protein SEC24